MQEYNSIPQESIDSIISQVKETGRDITQEEVINMLVYYYRDIRSKIEAGDENNIVLKGLGILYFNPAQKARIESIKNKVDAITD